MAVRCYCAASSTTCYFAGQLNRAPLGTLLPFAAHLRAAKFTHQIGPISRLKMHNPPLPTYPRRDSVFVKVVPLDYVAKTIEQQGMTNKNSKRMRSVS